jgi:hypothetical protein
MYVDDGGPNLIAVHGGDGSGSLGSIDDVSTFFVMERRWIQI